jgi:hypothetical protein
LPNGRAPVLKSGPSHASQVTNHLFKKVGAKHGMDLVSFNMQRGREFGIPGYMEFRFVPAVLAGYGALILTGRFPFQEILRTALGRHLPGALWLDAERDGASLHVHFRVSRLSSFSFVNSRARSDGGAAGVGAGSWRVGRGGCGKSAPITSTLDEPFAKPLQNSAVFQNVPADARYPLIPDFFSFAANI